MERLKDMFLGFMVYLFILSGLYLFSDRPSSEVVPLVSQEKTDSIKRNKATENSEDRFEKPGAPGGPIPAEPLNSILPKSGGGKKSLKQETFLSIISPSDKGRELQ